MSNLVKVIMLNVSVVIAMFSYSSSFAQFTTFQIGTASADAYTTEDDEATPFTTIFFQGDGTNGDVFENPPNVFIMTPQLPGDPCIVRITNVTTTSFDATCQEPLSEDRNGPAVAFDYLSIADGGVTVPLSNVPGDVVFQSACQDITTQQFGGNCDDCTGPESFTPITFANAFSSQPAVLVQVQTTNNDNNDELITL